MKNFRDKVIVITGAGSGIGLACAKAFLAEGARLHLIDKDEKIFEVVRKLGSGAVAHQVDVTDAVSFFKTADKIKSLEGHVDIIHNNAGVCLSKAVDRLTMDDWRWVLNVNLWGVIHGVQAFVPEMVRRRSGHVINTASLAGIVPFPMVVPYCATKYAVVGLSEALAAEVAPAGVGVTVECPGMVSTELFRNARVGWPDEIRSRFEKIMDSSGTDPNTVAKNILNAVKRGRVVHVTAGKAYPLYLLKRASWNLYGNLAGRIAGLRKDRGTGRDTCGRENPAEEVEKSVPLSTEPATAGKEIEIKLSLCSERDWRRLIDHPGRESVLLQENDFYDTKDRDLEQRGWFFRVRKEWRNPLCLGDSHQGGDSHMVILTLKGRSRRVGSAAIRPEKEKLLTKNEIASLLRERVSITSVWKEAFDELHDKSIDELVLTDRFVNERVRLKINLRNNECFLEVDKTVFEDGHVDYEVEMEMPDVSEEDIPRMEEDLRSFLNGCGVAIGPNLGGKRVRAGMHRIRNTKGNDCHEIAGAGKEIC